MVDIYNYAYPSSQKQTYTSGDQVDFILSFANKSIVRNSVRISGKLKVLNGGAALVNERVFYDATVGVHSAFNNLSVSSQLRGILELQQDYARYVKMKNMATKTSEMMVSSGKLINELCMSDYTKTKYVLAQPGATELGDDGIPFYLKPDICLNNFNGVQNNVGGIDYSQTGDITLSLRVCSPSEFLFGPDMTAAITFELSNLAVEYQTVPEQGQPILMVIKSSIKQTLNSSNAMISVNLPATASSICCSFMRVAEENNLLSNHIDCEKIPGLNKVYFSFNGATGQYISFPLESVQDILQHYLDSIHAIDALAGRINDKKHDLTLQLLNDNRAFGVGLDFDTVSMAANSSFGINIMSTVASDDPFYMYMYIHSLSQLGQLKK